MSVPRVAPVNVTTWLMFRLKRGSRYYRLHLEQDLWGSWLVTRVNGQRSAPLDHIHVSAGKSFEEGLAALATAAKWRKYALGSES